MKKHHFLLLVLALLGADFLQAQCDIPVYTYLGSYNGHHYYLSNEHNEWPVANARAYARGGYLAAINDAAENQVVAGWLDAVWPYDVWIGFNDIAAEGDFTWTSGEAVTYTNWAPSEPNDCCLGEDYTVINWWSWIYGPGYWNDLGVPDGPRRSVVEVGEDNSPCPLECHVYLGSLEGHDYYVSTDFATWTEANAIAQSLGGHLVAIGSAAENAFIESFFPGGDWLWIGLSDAASEGTFTWSNGDPVTYTNWSAGEPSNAGDEDFTIIWNDGTWNDFREDYFPLPYIIEFSGDADCDGVGDYCDDCPGGDDNGPCNATTFPGLGNIPADWLCHANGQKVYVCHNGNTICVNYNAVQAHLNHGDFLGPCTSCVAGRSVSLDDPLTVALNPNPATDQLLVSFSETSVPVAIAMFDHLGRQVFVTELPKHESFLRMSVAGFPAGAYYLRVTGGSETIVKKFMIVR